MEDLDSGKWLSSSVPPNSYKIQIAYVDTHEIHRQGKLDLDDTYTYDELKWQDQSERFDNYSQANIFGLKNHPMILYRITGSNDKPNNFVFSDYKSIEKPQMNPELKDYIQFLEKIKRIY